ncbi:MAG: type II secretion system secretin GspD [Xanthobacteraceae bacterium]
MLALAVAGCMTTKDPQTTTSASPNFDVVAQVREVDLRARSPQSAKSLDSTSYVAGPQPRIYYGDGTPAVVNAPPSSNRGAAAEDIDHQLLALNDPVTTGALPPADRDTDAKGYEMNFENTPVPTVAKVILGDILHVGYTIDARVQGTVTLASGRPVPRKDVLYVLEDALRVSNVALVREGNSYRLIPAGEAAGTGMVDSARGLEPGYGITVVPLQFVSATTLTKLLDNFAAKPGTVRADPSRNLLVIQGSAADRQAALETVHDFDADWMRGQSVGIFPVSNSTPEPVIAELEKIIDSGEGGLSQNLVKLQAVARQNAILAVAHQPALLKQIATWVARLDKAGTAGTSVRVYRMRYGNAREVARLLNNLFTGTSESGLDSATNQLAPGGGATASSSGLSNTGSAQQTGAAPQSGYGSSVQSGFGSSQQTPGAAQQSGTQLAANSGLGGALGGRSGSATRTAALGGASAESGGPPILPGVRIAADVTNNALLIYANQENYRIIERTLEQLDRPQLQVAIDATIAEVTLNDALNYGVQVFLQKGNLAIGSNTTPNATSTAISPTVPGFNFLFGSQLSPQVILNALHAVTAVKVVSTPSIVVVDNQSATLIVGDQIPVTTQTAVSVVAAGAPVVNNITYMNTGVILHVSPRINANGNVLLDIQQEISNVENNANATTLTPTVSQRLVKSSIAVASGQTVLLAGLISESKNESSSGIPGLDQIPGLGVLGAQISKSVTRDELIVFIRPQIIRNGVDAQRIAEELRAKMRGSLQPPGKSPLVK